MRWRKSTRCSDSFNCVEVATDAQVHVRDSKDPDGGILSYDPQSWRAFIAAVRAGDLNRCA